jgi:uncharacterized membrane protein YdbT with pleckstrin-like domain
MAKSYIESLLGQQEKIILVTRQHWFILVRAIFLEISAILIFLALSIICAIKFPQWELLVVAIFFILLLVPIGTMTRDILEWSNRQYLVTNRRVMQIAGIFNKNVIDSSLEKVNDVKMNQSALGRIFGYGDIEILTASELGVNLFKKIGQPILFKTTMLNAKEQMDHAIQAPGIDSPVTDSIPAMIASLDQLRKNGLLSEEEFQSKKKELISRM